MKEITIISGKGGTGKTTLTAALGVLAEEVVLADCDVDAPDLHILADPEIELREDFSGSVKARINTDKCSRCGQCLEACRFGAITDDLVTAPLSCEGCGVCFHVCPEDAISLDEVLNGHWFISKTRMGPMVHAALLPGEENSGKLVALVRNQARVLAKKERKSLIIVDGAPGVGCPVIASVTGADHAIIVTEPTMSGLHDMRRAFELVRGFSIPVSIVVNKSDIHPEMTETIRQFCDSEKLGLLGTIPYDRAVIEAMVAKRTVVENGDGPARRAIDEIWERFGKSILEKES